MRRKVGPPAAQRVGLPFIPRVQLLASRLFARRFLASSQSFLADMKSFAKMRTITTLLSAFLLLTFAFGAGEAYAQDATVSIPTVSAEADESVSVPVNVQNFNNVGAITLVINYDASVLSFEELQNTPRSGFIGNSPSDGELRITWFDASASNPINIDAGTLLDIGFSFSGGTSDVAFDANASEIADIDANVLDVNYSDGVVSGDVGELSLGVVQDASPGGTVDVALTAEDLTDVGAVSLRVGYDAQALNFEELASDDSGLDLQASASDGVLSVGGFDTEGVTLQDTVATFSFTYLGGSSPLVFQADTEISASDASEKAVGLVNGNVSGATPRIFFADQTAVPEDTVNVAVQAENLSSVGSLSLTVDFNDAALDFVDYANEVQDFNITVNQSGTGVVTIGGFSAAGVDLGDKVLDLQFATTESTTSLGFDVANSEVTTTGAMPYNVAFESGQLNVGNLMLGDVQGNGVVDAGDASLVLQYVVGARTLNEVQLAAADVDGNGEIQAADASLILQFVVGAISEFPAEGGSAIFAASKSASAQLSWGKVERVDGSKTLRVPVELSDVQGDVMAAQFTLRFDPSVVSVEDVESALPSSWQVVHHTQASSGLLKVAMAGTESIRSGRLATIELSSEGAPGEVTLTGSGLVNAGTTQSMGPVGPAQSPSTVTLESNYPNPFRGSTTISYGLPSEGQVTIEVYNVTGQKVATLVNRKQGAGTHRVSFDASGLASGMYMYRLTVDDVTKTGRMTIVK